MATSRALYRTARLLTSRCYSVNTRPENLWTPENIVISPYKDVDIPNTTVPEHLWQNIEKWADKTAVICGITHRQYTYHQLFKLSHNLAANLRKKLQVSDGDSVSIMMHNSPDYALAVLGILQSGAELTTINPIYTPHEVQRQLIVSDPKIIIGSPQTVPIIKQAFKLIKKEIPIITVVTNEELPPGTISFQELVEDDNADHSVLKEVIRKSEDVSILPYSSGTTGLPKGVELTNRNIVVNCVQQDVEGVKQYHDTTSSHQDSVICVLPFYHIYGLSVAMFHKLSVGAKLVTLPKFQSHTFLTALKEHKVTVCYAAPPIVLFLGSHPDVRPEHLQSLQKVMCGAGPVYNEDIKKLLARAKGESQMEFLQLYGLTETSPLASSMRPGATNYTTAGFALPNTEFKVIDADSKALGPNEVGELLIRGPQVMKGYRNNPEATKESITEDGWFKTGDLATLHEDGTVTITDRLKELIKVKGYQVPPAELENVLKEHPDVLDAGVVGIPDHRKGEVPRAFVVLKDGHKTDPNNIVEFVKGRVAEFKRIQDVVILDSLPKNPSGKLLRRVLKEKYC